MQEGQAVRAGEVLFVLALERSTLDAGTQAQVQRSLDERARSLNERGVGPFAGAAIDANFSDGAHVPNDLTQFV